MSDTTSQQPPAKRIKHDFSQSFDVLVGPKKKRFSVVHDVLTARSGFFEAARSSRWKPDPSTPTDLTDHDPQEFSAYLELVYTGSLTCSDTTLSQWYDDHCPAEKWGELKQTHCAHIWHLIKLYVLADKLQDPTSANCIMDVFVRCYDRSARMLSSSLVTWIYQHTPPGSPLRNVVRDTIMYEASDQWYKEHDQNDLPHALLFDVLKEYALTKEAQGETLVSDAYPNHILCERSKCHYHRHDDEHPKCK